MFVTPIVICFYLTLANGMDTNPANFFPNINGNLTKISWAHAVNNQSYLNATLKSNVDMIEADIVMGKVNGTGDIIPIMGHPPQTSSDLSLVNFLTIIDNFNKETPNAKKGVKLDFKTIEVFQHSVGFLEQLYNNMDYPIWINADIINGPVNAATIPVDPNKFLQLSKEFTKSVLSIGWTTNYGYNSTTKVNITEGSYDNSQINEMLLVIEKNNVLQNITFPVRAGMAAESHDQMERLIKNVKNSTLTIWSSNGDTVNVNDLKSLIQKIGVDKVYVDVPENLHNQLRLDISGSANFSPLLNSHIILLISFILLIVLI